MITADKMIKRRERAKVLRSRGMLYKDIGKELGVSDTMARHYVNGRASGNTRILLNSPCLRSGPHQTSCKRLAGHDGIHLANDKDDRLIYWE
jgi:hypothetical protein